MDKELYEKIQNSSKEELIEMWKKLVGKYVSDMYEFMDYMELIRTMEGLGEKRLKEFIYDMVRDENDI